MTRTKPVHMPSAVKLEVFNPLEADDGDDVEEEFRLLVVHLIWLAEYVGRALFSLFALWRDTRKHSD